MSLIKEGVDCNQGKKYMICNCSNDYNVSYPSIEVELDGEVFMMQPDNYLYNIGQD